MDIASYMKIALKEAIKAYHEDEVPIGAVLVCNGKIIAQAHNTNENDNDALAHAEIKVIKQGCQKLNSKYLDDCDLYVTLEPCMMCTGAILNARIRKVYFAAYNLNDGYIFTNHQTKGIEWQADIDADKSIYLLKKYFAKKRKGLDDVPVTIS